MLVSLIAAVSRNLVLGKDNHLPWNLPPDTKFFKDTTTGHVVIMGRKTYESMGRPLPKRTNIVVTRNPDITYPDGVIKVSSITEAIQKAQALGETEAFIIGGGQIYTESLTLADKLYLTIIDKDFDGDTFFPPYDQVFTKVVSEEKQQYEDLPFRFLMLKK